MTSNAQKSALTDRTAQGGDLLTPADVAAMLKVSKRTVFRLRAAGVLPPPLELSTNLIRWRAEDIVNFINGLQVRRRRHSPGVRSVRGRENEIDSPNPGPSSGLGRPEQGGR